MKQARSEDNILSPEARPASPLLVAYMSTPVSREGTPQHDDIPVELNPELQEYYGQKFVFDEVKEFLDTRADDGGFLDTCP